MSDVVVSNGTQMQVFVGGNIPSLTKKQAEKSTGVKAKRYLSFIQMIQKSSAAVDAGAKPGSFLLKQGGKDDKPITLGDEFNAVLVSVRGRAQHYDGKTVFTEYDLPREDGTTEKSDRYDDFREKSKDPMYKKGGKLYRQTNPHKSGLDLLLYLPDQGSFATYFANTETTVAEVEENIIPFVQQPIIFGSRVRKNAENQSWFVPAASLTEAVNWQEPDEESTEEALKQFLYARPNRGETVVEGATESEDNLVR